MDRINIPSPLCPKGMKEQKERRHFWHWLLFTVIVVSCNFFVARLAIVYGASMEPTLQQYDFVLVWQWNYQPKAGDIVVTTADNAVGQSVIKRVIAVEGQNFSYELDGKQIEITVPEGQVFLMGDNVQQSVDSRVLGCFDVEEIRGRVVARIFPFTKIRKF